EEDHAGAPHGRGAPKERQDHLAHHRLHHEEQRGADKERERVEQQDGGQGRILPGPPPGGSLASILSAVMA
nr:hypothetical protein [Pseudomonadota bacterium]